ncbi:MAG: hypothetical protein IKR04_04500 [Clostridia bacterium]|nr:hypothetical protein [Clostridia bacterium]
MDELVESILDYIRKPYTDHAIMINGEWGSGKTYFWNNKVRSKIESTEINGKKYRTIYMSLYGISNLDDISKKIFMEMNPNINKTIKKILDSRNMSSIPEYVKTGMDMANSFGVMQANEKVDFTKFFEMDDKVLCFDDLERANVDVIDVLGYINNFVEHDHIKTIIICNEKELSKKLKSTNVEMKTFIATYILSHEGKIKPETPDNEAEMTTISTEDGEEAEVSKPMVELIEDTIEHIFDKANDYERIKEKLIGETFEYVPEFNYIINGVLMRYEANPDLIMFLRKNASLIVQTFNRSGTRNLRILKHALNDFQKIYETTKQEYPDVADVVLKSLLIFTIAVSFEIKAGKVTKDKLKDINSLEEYKMILVASKLMKDNKQFYIKEFDNNYYFTFKTDYRFFKFVEHYVRTRIFDMKIFRDDMDAIVADEDRGHVPSYKRLLTEDYWKIEDNEFSQIITETLEDVKAGKLQLVEYLKLYVILNFFIQKGLLDIDMEFLKLTFVNGMNMAAATSKYCDNVESYLGGVEIEKDDDNISYIYEHFNNLNLQTKEKEYINISKEFFEMVPDKIERLSEVFAEKHLDVPIMKYYNMNTLFERIMMLNNEDVVMFKDLIVARYNKVANLENEERNIRLLKQTMEEYIRGKIPTIKIVLLEDFIKALDKILLDKKPVKRGRGRKKKVEEVPEEEE